MTSYSREFLENLRKTGGQLPPDPTLKGRPPSKPMGQTTAAYSANLRDQVKAGTMTNAQGQEALNAFIKQQAVMRTAPQAPRLGELASPPPQMRTPTPGGPPAPPMRTPVMPMPTPAQPPRAQTPIIGSTLGGIGAPKSSAPYMPSATAPTGPAPVGPPTTPTAAMRMKKGGKVAKPPVKKMAKGGSTASSRGDGCAVRGKTRGKIC